MAGYDFIGNIAILKFDKKISIREKKKIAGKIMRERKNVRTVLEKIERVKGRLRTLKTKYILGEKTKEALYKENNCLFKLNVDSCYFSPRLSNERLEIAKEIGRKDRVLVMFAGVAPYSIVIAKISGCRKVVSVELSRECCKYARENVQLNRLNNVEIIQGDVKKKVNKKLGKFNFIVMPRPQLKEDFLKQAFLVSKKGTRIFYYDFSQDYEEIAERIRKKARENKKKIKILKIKKAGEIAPYKYRFRVDFKVL